MAEQAWTPTQVVGAFFLFVVTASLLVQVLVYRAKKRVRRRHVVVGPWIPIVRELVARGVTAPEVLACALAGWDLKLTTSDAVGARLPCGVATVAEVLGRPLPEIQLAVLTRALDPANAAALLEELRALRSRLDGLPGVREVGDLWPDDPALLAKTVRRYAPMCAASPPRR
jgi:hypothetical protein